MSSQKSASPGIENLSLNPLFVSVSCFITHSYPFALFIHMEATHGMKTVKLTNISECSPD